MVGYLMGSLVLAVIGVAVAVAVLRVAAVRARRRRELARRHSEIASQDELKEYLRRVDQVTAADELDHLGNEEGNT
jgi:type II secretory pathway pseudopilin PulG